LAELEGKTIGLMSATGVHEHEFWVPYYRFREEGAQILVCGLAAGIVYQGEGRNGKDGLDLAATDAAVADVDPDGIDALVIPGGIYGPLELRNHEPTLRLVRAMDECSKVIGAICHGQWVLVSADVLRGRRATSPRDIAPDLRNAGAEWVDEEVVRDGNLVTAVYFGYLPQFCRTLVEAIAG
jgi:protease I